MIGVVVVDYTGVSQALESARRHGAWSERAQDFAKRIQQTCEWDERIRAAIKWREGSVWVLHLEIEARGKCASAIVDLLAWEQMSYHPNMIMAAFDRLMRVAMVRQLPSTHESSWR